MKRDVVFPMAAAQRSPTILSHIDTMLQTFTEQCESLLEAKDTPFVLDDSLVNRVIQVFTKARQDLPLFDEQLQRWETDTVTEEQCQEMLRLKGLMQ